MFTKRIAAILLTLAASVLVSQAQNAAQVLRPIGVSPGGPNLAPGQSQAAEEGGPQGQFPPGQDMRGMRGGMRGMRGMRGGMPPGDPNAAANAANAASAPASQTPTLPTGYLLIKTLDTNHDGVIDANEINNAPAALLTLDINGDGKLTEDEYMAKGEPRPCFSPIYKILDLNENGILEAKEIAGAASALRVLDKNFDSKLTAGEYRPSAAAYAEHNAAVSAAAAKVSAPPSAPQP